MITKAKAIVRSDGTAVEGARLARPMQGPVRRLALLTVATTFALALTAAPASALDTHAFSTSFGTSGTGDGQLSNPQSVAVNSTSHDVYVADTANARIDQFSSSGAFIRAFGADVGGAGVNTCTTGCVAGTPGSTAGAFTTPAFIAVDNSAASASQGDVYVADTGTNLVQKFDASGALITTWGTGGQLDGSTATDGPFGALAGIAVDTSGNLDVLDANSGFMFRFAEDGTFATDFAVPRGVSPFGIAVDSAGNLYFVAGDPVVEKIDPTGADIGQVSLEARDNTTGLAIDPSSDELYADFGGGVIDHYAPSCTPDPTWSVGCNPNDSFGSTHLSAAAGLAVDPTDQSLYAADTGNARIALFTPATLADVTTGAASDIAPTTATLDGTVNPAGVQLTDCHFDYVDDADYNPSAPNPYAAGQTAPCVPDAATIPADSNDHAVHADLTGLTAGTSYHFHLVAANANGQNQATDATFSTPPPPSIDAAFAANLTPTDADLNAQINPSGVDTTYHFEWGTANCSSNPCTSAPIPDGDIGSGTTDVPVMTHLTGLSANTTYHWRIIATNPSGTSGAAADHTFIYDTTGQGLPDDRAYEQVTPPQKNGALVGDVSFVGPQPDIAADGSRVIASSIQCFAGATSCNAQTGDGIGSPYSFTRTPAGWQPTPLAPPATQFPRNAPWAYVADTGAALFSMPTPPFGEDDFYKREADGSFTDIGPVTPPAQGPQGPAGGGAVGGQTQGLTADLSHFVWDVDALSWPFDAWTGQSGGQSSAYEYAGTGSAQPLLVGVGGPNDGPGSTDLISTCGTTLGGAVNGLDPGTLSIDGRTVYFTASGADTPGCPSTVFGSGSNAATPVPAAALYARIEGELPSAHTVAISQPSPSDCSGACLASPPADAVFEGASQDGSSAFFTSTQQLTDAASQDNHAGDTAFSNGCATTTGANGCNLYLYDFQNPAGHNLVDASAGDVSGAGPRVRTVMAISSDGSHAYFVAQGVLASNLDANGHSAQSGANNLYAYDAATGATSFIAALPDSDDFHFRAYGRTPNVTPDGRFLVFVSHGNLTPDDSSLSGARQVFRYDAQTGALERISVGNDGFNDNGNRPAATPCETRGCSEDASVAIAFGARRDPTMSDDGSRVFFQSPLALTPRALNDVRISTTAGGNPLYALNLYEWHAGHVSLISDGHDASQNAGGSALCPNGRISLQPSSVCLLGSDATGDNVFFTTADRLVPQDTDTELDYYDARVGGGFPFTPPPEPCSGDNCKPSPSGTPTDQTPGSSALNGPGNQGKNLGGSTTSPKKHKKCKKHHKCKHKKSRRANTNRGGSK